MVDKETKQRKPEQTGRVIHAEARGPDQTVQGKALLRKRMIVRHLQKRRYRYQSLQNRSMAEEEQKQTEACNVYATEKLQEMAQKSTVSVASGARRLVVQKVVKEKKRAVDVQNDIVLSNSQDTDSFMETDTGFSKRELQMKLVQGNLEGKKLQTKEQAYTTLQYGQSGLAKSERNYRNTPMQHRRIPDNDYVENHYQRSYDNRTRPKPIILEKQESSHNSICQEKKYKPVIPKKKERQAVFYGTTTGVEQRKQLVQQRLQKQFMLQPEPGRQKKYFTVMQAARECAVRSARAIVQTGQWFLILFFVLALLVSVMSMALFSSLAMANEHYTAIPEEAQQILAQLPTEISVERRAVVEQALSLVGKVHYFWGGKSPALGWNPAWGELRQVTAAGSPTTGTKRPYGLDCSGFIDWVFFNATQGDYLIGEGGGVRMQRANCIPISWQEAQPGDLVFYADNSHIGMVCGKTEHGLLQIVQCASGADAVIVSTGQGAFTDIGRPILFDKTEL